MSEVALWYMRHHAPGYDIFDSEEEAARTGAWMAEAGEGAVLGVQFPDGRTISRENWAPYALAVQQIEEEWRQRAAKRKAEPPRPTRRILDPFNGQMLTVDTGEPGWLGKPS